MPDKKIGVFDSGFGGLDILRSIVDVLPEHDFVYLGDTARAPYGSRSRETIYEYVIEALKKLFEEGCQLVVLACNTASAEALRRVQQEFLPQNYPDRRVLGVIIPAVEGVIESGAKKIGVIATESTIASGAFPREIAKKDIDAEVFTVACPLIAPLVEAGEEDSEIIHAVLKKYLKQLPADTDTLILGCTHYGILSDDIGKVLRDLGNYSAKVVSVGAIVAEKLEDYLRRHPEIDQLLSKNRDRKFMSTDLTDKFEKLGTKFFGEEISVVKVDL